MKKLEGDRQSGRSLLVFFIRIRQSREENGSIKEQTGVVGGFENSSFKMFNQSDIDAAYTLMKLANECPVLVKKCSSSVEMKNGLNRMPRVRYLWGKLKSNKLSDGICSQDDRREANHERFQRTAF